VERFVLTAMTLRGTKFVPVRGAQPEELDWNGLCEKLAPAPEDRVKLRVLKRADIIGIKRHAQGRRNFLLSNTDRSGNVAWLLKKQPTVFDAMECAYRVEEVVYDQRIVEKAS
jgi:hypothetical protein